MRLLSLMMVISLMGYGAAPAWAADSKGSKASGPATLIADAVASDSGEIEDQNVQPERSPNFARTGMRVQRPGAMNAAPGNPNRSVSRPVSAPARSSGVVVPRTPNSGSGRPSVPSAPSRGTGVSVPSNPNSR